MALSWPPTFSASRPKQWLTGLLCSVSVILALAGSVSWLSSHTLMPCPSDCEVSIDVAPNELQCPGSKW